MRPNYRELLEELWAITDHDGFVATCVELKESMLFYDRDLVLAGYSGTVEALLGSALLWSCFESRQAFAETAESVRKLMSELPERIVRNDSPVDIQAMVENFLRIGGWILAERVPVYISMFDRYLDGAGSGVGLGGRVEALLLEAQQVVVEHSERARDLVAEAGAVLLTGGTLRPGWFRIARPRLQVWLTGIRNLLANFAASDLAFPFGPIDREREKRRTGNGNVVVELKRFRDLRQASSRQPPTGVMHYQPDRVDELLADLFCGEPKVTGKLLKGFRQACDDALPALLALVESDHLIRGDTDGEHYAPINAMRVLGHLKRPEAVGPIIRLLSELDPEDDAFEEALRTLARLGAAAVDSIVDYLRERSEGDGFASLALVEVLSAGPRNDKVYGILIDMFNRLRWDEGKAVVGSALARYGDRRALPSLEASLRGSCRPDEEELAEMEWAIRRLRRPERAGSRPHKVRRKPKDQERQGAV
ncbi:MAG: hypothetical protein HYY08_03335 [Firmicutes bacterium]|nr:hypothetical protein [Bacillota bacterium]